jgi:recombination protein RecA
VSAAVVPLFRDEARAPRARDGGESWRLDELQGRLCELSADRNAAQLTAAFDLVRDAQRSSEPAAIVMTRETTFYPPDLEGSGVDLDTLVVVRVPDGADVPRAAEYLVRSGSFGLVVCDLGARARVPMPLLSRLSGLARKHVSAVVFLTEKDEDSPSLGSLVSLRAQVERTREDEGLFSVSVRVLKDKRRAPGWGFAEVRRGPAGVR